MSVLLSSPFPSGFPTKVLYAFLFSPCMLHVLPIPSHWILLLHITVDNILVIEILILCLSINSAIIIVSNLCYLFYRCWRMCDWSSQVFTAVYEFEFNIWVLMSQRIHSLWWNEWGV
jgi:hypothetical protein